MKKLLAILLCLLLISACSNNGKTDPDNKNTSTNTKNNTLEVSKTKAQLLAETIEKREVEDIFTVNMPRDWEVSIAGRDSIYIWIRLYDPSQPNLQVFTNITLTGILKSENAKKIYQKFDSIAVDNLYKSSADAVANDTGTLEEFFLDYSDFISWLAAYEPLYQGFDYPLITNFKSIESWPVDNVLSSIALDNQLIHGEFLEGLSNEKSEGLFSGTLVDAIKFYAEGEDLGYYTIYDLSGITAPYGMLSEYKDVLRNILGSIEYTEEFINKATKNQEIAFKTAQQVNAIMQQTSQIIVDGWNQRQQSYDRMSQAYSDSTLGYDRYYDTETGDVYRVEYGVMDSYTGDRYQLIESGSDLYSLPVTGYVYK